MSLFLIGMRAVGKSAVGALAARRLGVRHVDSDAVIEERAGLTVADLFRELGEGRFRSIERELLLEVLPRPGQLVSTGGGCVLDPEVRAALREHGCVVWLRAPVAVLRRRIGSGRGRPSLTGGDPREELEELLAAREALYRECAQTTVETGKRSIDEVARVIEQLWSFLPDHDLR